MLKNKAAYALKLCGDCSIIRKDSEKEVNLMKYKLIASDLDGTLLNSDAEVTEANFKAIREMKEMGVLFVPVTGRAMYEMPESVYACDDIRYVISSNGSVIYDKETGEKSMIGFSFEEFKEVFAILNSYTTTMTVHCDLRSVTDAARGSEEMFEYYRLNDYYRKHIRATNVFIDNFEEYFSVDRETEMFSVFFRYEEELKACKAELEALGYLDITASTSGNLEIIRHGALKGHAVTTLAAKLGMDLSEIISVGDSRNDLSMIEITGLSLATSNALDVLKEAADEVICSNNENIAEYIVKNYL